MTEKDMKEVLNGRNVVYGIFEKFVWRDEKSGSSIFDIKSRGKLPGGFYRKTVKEGEEIYYIISVNGGSLNLPVIAKNTPLRCVGRFDKSGEFMSLIADIVEENSADEQSLSEFLVSELGIPEQAALNISKAGEGRLFEMDMPELAKVCEDSGLMPERAQSAAWQIFRMKEMRRLFELIAPYGMSFSQAKKSVEKFGPNTVKAFMAHPYYAGQRADCGITFHNMDRLAKALGFNAYSEERLVTAAFECLKNMGISSGHTWAGSRAFERELEWFLFDKGVFDEEIPFGMIEAILRDRKEIYVSGVSGTYKQTFALKSARNAEFRIRDNIMRLMKDEKKSEPSNALIEAVQKNTGFTLGTQQREAFSMALSGRGIRIVTGGPGTGKTTTIKSILCGYSQMYPDHKIALCAPTGRAAQRMQEGCGMPAKTVHRLLEYKIKGGQESYKNRTSPIDAKLIVVDEMSMADMKLFDMLLEAVSDDTMLLLVGDINQLESVGSGAILRDLLSRPGIPKTMLTEVFRQKGGSPIVENAYRINSGISELVSSDDFVFIRTEDEEETAEKVKELVLSMHDKADPFKVQVLSPVRKGLSGVDGTNKSLQDALNPKGRYLAYGGNKFRSGDKIIFTMNNYSDDAGYCNGDIGIIEQISDEGLTISLRDTKVSILREEMGCLKLAYAMTVHKSQGSEFPVAIVVLPLGTPTMLVRNLLYTGVTRAKKKCIIISEGDAFEKAVENEKTSKRRTLLSQIL